METVATEKSPSPSFKERLGKKLMARFNARRRIGTSFREVPENLHKVASQLSLGLELLDDFRAGNYRTMPWGSLAILSGALLYAVSPVDVLPDALLGLGALDDAIVVALAIKLVRPQLETYCAFKGYSPDDYFPIPSERTKRKASATINIEPMDVPA